MKHFLILAGMILIATLMSRTVIATSPYGYDESDYMFDASLGVFNNWVDADAMPLPDYIRVGLSRGKDTKQRTALSEMARSKNDPNVYRHWHGPLYYYWLVAASAFHPSEPTMRGLFLIFPILTVILIYLGTLALFPGRLGFVAALLASSLYLFSPVNLSDSEVAPHLCFALLYTGSLLCLSMVMKGRTEYWFGAIVAAGLAFCTLEVTFVLVLTAIICGFLMRKELQVNVKFILKSLGAFVAPILVVWPAGLLKLTAVKAYLFMAYLAIFRKGAWGNVTLADTWKMRFVYTPLEWAMIATALILFFVAPKISRRREALPFLIFAGFMILAVLRVQTDVPRYAIVFLPALDVFAGWTIAAAVTSIWTCRISLLIPSVLSVLLALVSGYRLTTLRPSAGQREWQLIQQLRSQGYTDGDRILAPQGWVPMLHYYFPQVHWQGYLNASEVPTAVTESHPKAVVYDESPGARVEAAPAPGQ